MTNLLKRGFGSITAIVGVLLILAALWLTLSNIHTDNAAGERNTTLLTRSFFDEDGRLRTIPAQRKKRLIVLERLAEAEAGR